MQMARLLAALPVVVLLQAAWPAIVATASLLGRKETACPGLTRQAEYPALPIRRAPRVVHVLARPAAAGPRAGPQRVALLP
jgi:hypothetical protein